MKKSSKFALSSLLLLIALVGVGWSVFDPAALLGSRQQKNDNLIAEEMAYHVGTLAYLYGYPIVDMLSQMHNETHRTGPEQSVYAPVNQFYRFPGLVNPDNSGNFRAPNADTLYFTAWFDIADEPLVLSTPDTEGRYFTVAVTNLYAEVSHIGRRTTGTTPGHFALVTPDWSGTLPESIKPHPVETRQGWLLGRMYVAGTEDLEIAERLVEQIELTPLSQWPSMDTNGTNPTMGGVTSYEEVAPIQPHDSLQFFTLLDSALRELPPRPEERALLAQFQSIGLGADTPLDLTTLPESTRKGLERALEGGAELVAAATQRTIESYNGWMISMAIGRYGFDYLHRAAVAKGGYGNLPEESLYPAAVFDAEGNLMSGGHRYQITFPANALPPTRGFWSIAAYDLWTLQMVDNPINRFTLGDRTQDLQYNPDGSLTLYLQHTMPATGSSNWLPVPEGQFMLVMRLYEPEAAALNHDWIPPAIEKLDD